MTQETHPARRPSRGRPVGEGEAVPGQAVPGQAVPGQAVPGQAVPGQAVPGTRLPPGQHVPRAWPVMHYGPVPQFREDRWDLRVGGATASGVEHCWDWESLAEMPRREVTADFHCVTKFTLPAVTWEGIPALDLLAAAPPAPDVTHVMVWADYGYSANLRIGDFADELTIFATGVGGADLTPEHGFPLRLVAPRLYGWKSVKWVRAVEYLTVDRRGFWEERGYHNVADPWREQRFSHQEEPGEGPPL